MLRISRLFKSFHYAVKGLIKTFKEEQNFKIQSLAGIFVLLLALFFRVSLWEWCLLVFAITLVLLAELINSGMERVADALKPRLSGYVKEIKDIMAAAVMLSSISAIIVGAIIFWPYFCRLFF